MTALRAGEYLPPQDDGYDPNADMRALQGSHKRKHKDNDSFMSREQLMELRKVQAERIEVRYTTIKMHQILTSILIGGKNETFGYGHQTEYGRSYGWHFLRRLLRHGFLESLAQFPSSLIPPNVVICSSLMTPFFLYVYLVVALCYYPRRRALKPACVTLSIKCNRVYKVCKYYQYIKKDSSLGIRRRLAM